MYTLLIVDDELPALHALQAAIDWDAQGVHEIYTACSAAQARKLISVVQIDIIICDIEMPGENGVSFMKWVREMYENIRFIFLSVHDQSDFIRTAIHHGCTDYLLKPVRIDELTESVQKAIKSLETQRKLQQYDDVSGQLRHNLAGTYVNFWREYLTGRLSNDRRAVQAECARRGLLFHVDEYMDSYDYFMMLLCVRKWTDAIEDDERQRMLFAIRNVAEETFVKARCMGQFFHYAGDMLAGCFMLPKVIGQDVINLPGMIREIDQTCRQFFACKVQIFFSDAMNIMAMPAHFQQMLRTQKSIVSDAKWIHVTEDDAPPEHAQGDEPPDFGAWRLLIRNKNLVVLRREIYQYLEQHSVGGEMTVAWMQQFRWAYTWLLYDELQKDQILLLHTPDNQRLMELEQYASHSIEATVDWCMLMVEYVSAPRNAEEQQSNLAAGIKQYIDMHLENPLSREELSGVFFITQDYLGKVFKKENGIGLAAYIQEARIRKACLLLSQTEIAVGDVGMQVGISNFSYFCKVFRAQVGVSPQQYRKQHQRKE